MEQGKFARGGWLYWRGLAALIALIVASGFIVSGCGGADAKENGEITLTVASRGYAEEKVLREIYAQSLEAAGFEVKRRSTGGLPPEEMEKGLIAGYPDHLDTALTERTSLELEDAPVSAKVAYQEVKRQAGETGFVAFPPASLDRANVIGVRKETAEESGLEALADLKGPSARMRALVAGVSCPNWLCLVSFERAYGITFEGFSAVDDVGSLYKALRSGKTDAIVLTNTDGRLASEKRWLVLLEDEQHRMAAGNVFWMTNEDAIDEAGPDYEEAIVDAQDELTLDVIRELTAQVELEGKSPVKVVAVYLKSAG